MSVDVYAPWHEDLEALEARHTHRQDTLEAIEDTITGWLAGKSSISMYLFGPRGSGKSHLLALSCKRARKQGVRVGIIPEDIPILGDAGAVMQRIIGSLYPSGWQSWKTPKIHPMPEGRCVVFFEGIDRQLKGLNLDGRRTLRRLLTEQDRLLIIATGVTLDSNIVGRDEAFYHHFSVWPVAPLDAEPSGLLLDRVSGPEATGRLQWPARRSALITLSGGSPRTLVALGQSCCQNPDAWASQHLQNVVRQFTAHYQMRFRDLPPQGQRILELLAEAPRELSPTEMGEVLGLKTSHISSVARRMASDGVLSVRQEGRSSSYRISEPLFRYWHEYRTASWDVARIGLIGRLLEAIATPVELVDVLSRHQDVAMRSAAAMVLERKPEAMYEVAAGLVPSLQGAILAGDAEQQEALAARLLALPMDALCVTLAAPAFLPTQPHIRQQFRDKLSDHGPSVIAVAWDFALDGGDAREGFRTFLSEAADWLAEVPAGLGRDLISITCFAAIYYIRLHHLPLSERERQTWRLSTEEKHTLAQMSGLRALFLRQGRDHDHPPLLKPADIPWQEGDTQLDWNELMRSGMMLSDPTVFGWAMSTDLDNPIAGFAVLWDCPSPHLAAPGSLDRLAQLLGGAMATGDLTTQLTALSWIVSLHTVPEPVWQTFLDSCVCRNETTPARSPDQTPAISAMLVFTLIAPARMDALCKALSGDSILGGRANLSRELARSLIQDTTTLQPELEAVRQFLLTQLPTPAQ